MSLCELVFWLLLASFGVMGLRGGSTKANPGHLRRCSQRGSQPAASGISSTAAPLSAISCNKLRSRKQPSETYNWWWGRVAGSIGAACLLRRVPA